MEPSSKALLELEGHNSSLSPIKTSLLLCKTNESSHSQTTKPTQEKPTTCSVPKSQVLGKVKDFLGVFSEANKRLQLDAKDNAMDHDIEVLTGNESEYIEMDLMLGVADLHTPEAVAAAESAIAGHQPVISLAASSSSTGSESEDSSSDDDDDNDNDDDDIGLSPPTKRSKPDKDHSSREGSRNGRSKKQQKIVELA